MFKSAKIREGAVQGGRAFAPLSGFSAVLMLLLGQSSLCILLVCAGVFLIGVIWGASSAARTDD